MIVRFDRPPDLAALTRLVRDCSVANVGRRVLLLRTDLLPARLSRQHHVEALQEALEPLLGAERARRFDLQYGRVAIAWRGEAPERLQQTLAALEDLVLADPLDAPSVPELARLFDLPLDGAALLALAGAPSAPEEEVLAALPPPPPPSPPAPLDPVQVAGMERALQTANVARFARRRLVCRMGPAVLTPAWEQRYLRIDELVEAMAPGHTAFADPWLCRRLRRTLDRRMLALLSNPAELRDAGAFALELDVAAVLSTEFLRFDAGLPPGLRGQVVLALHPADVLADVPAFRLARAFARLRSYRVLLRGVEPAVLAAIDLPGLELDFAELRWSKVLNGLAPALLRAGSARWVLAGADEPAALRWGRAMGFGLFQGSIVQPGPWNVAVDTDPPSQLLETS